MRTLCPVFGEGCFALWAGSVHGQAVVAGCLWAPPGLHPLSSAAPTGKASVSPSADKGPGSEPCCLSVVGAMPLVY